MFFKSKKKAIGDSKIVLGMIMLKENTPFNLQSFQEDLKETAGYRIDDVKGDGNAATLMVDGELVAIGSMPSPIPMTGIEETARYAYNWPTVVEDVKDHKGHLIVSIAQGGDDSIKKYKVLTKVIAALLRTNDALGVYMGAQILLISKDDYLEQAESMDDEFYPLHLWIYFGFHHEEGKNYGYTYGLKEFGRRELEIVNSPRDLADINKFLFNITHYVLEYNVEFKAGQTIGGSESEKIKITLSPGVFVKEDSFKIHY